jgi:hypothetical protein
MPGAHERGWSRVVCCASGPSFTQAQADIVERARVEGRCRVIAVNTTGLTLMPNADVLFAADPPWWTQYVRAARATNVGELWTSSPVAAQAHEGLRLVAKCNRQDVREPDTVSGANSGQQAIALAHLFGACCIALVGYDMQYTGGRSHHHGDHPGKMHNAKPQVLKAWANQLAPLVRELEADGVGVINCTLRTAIACVPRVALESIL